VLVVVLALGALLWPGSERRRGQGVLLVFDPSGNSVRAARVYEPLRIYLNGATGSPLELVVETTRETFAAVASEGADFILCPDGLGCDLDPDDYVPVVTGRRSAPRNLRPRGVLVYRRSAGKVAAPWLERPEATVCGDSISLTATGPWRRSGKAVPDGPTRDSGCSWGPDPYDHAPVLHAARLGAFDYALVRQWDADRFFADGLLSDREWDVEIMTVPVPDIVLFASRSVKANARLAVGDGLANLGRSTGEANPAAGSLRQAIGELNLAGFNLLLEPDFDSVRRNFAVDWPTDTD
jgi:hypothetical protein